MANWHENEQNDTAKPEKRARFRGRRKSEKTEAAPSEVSKDGLRAERQRIVEAYYGVYPADAAARSRANSDLRYPPARLEATG